MKKLEKQLELVTENEWVANLILADPAKYKPGSLMETWARSILSQKPEANRNSTGTAQP